MTTFSETLSLRTHDAAPDGHVRESINGHDEKSMYNERFGI